MKIVRFSLSIIFILAILRDFVLNNAVCLLLPILVAVCWVISVSMIKTAYSIFYNFKRYFLLFVVSMCISLAIVPILPKYKTCYVLDNGFSKDYYCGERDFQFVFRIPFWGRVTEYNLEQSVTVTCRVQTKDGQNVESVIKTEIVASDVLVRNYHEQLAGDNGLRKMVKDDVCKLYNEALTGKVLLADFTNSLNISGTFAKYLRSVKQQGSNDIEFVGPLSITDIRALKSKFHRV